MNFLQKLFGQEQGQRGVERCYRCHKSLREVSAGIYGGADLVSMVSRSPYPCKSCGVNFCVDCMAKLRVRGSCLKCGGSLGW